MSHYATLRKDQIVALYEGTERGTPPDGELLRSLGPLQSTFEDFLAAERALDPLPDETAVRLLKYCATPGPTAEEIVQALNVLAPGGGRVGYRQVNMLTDYWRGIAQAHLRMLWGERTLVEHDSAFGSGGDIVKTGHATTAASVVVAPARPICKTGTRNVTSEHGSVHAISAFGYTPRQPDLDLLNRELSEAGFAFLSLADLGLPYSEAMVTARRRLWEEGLHEAGLDPANPTGAWHKQLAEAVMPIDIFKVAGANAQPLNPANHSTGICHIRLLPYVLGIYLYTGTRGLIAYGYDGIDELSTAASDPTPNAPNNVVVQVTDDSVIIAEVAPEDLGLPRATLDDITQDADPREEAADFMRMLAAGERRKEYDPRRDFIVANASVLLVAGGVVSTEGGLVDDLRAGVQAADKLISTGRSREAFDSLLNAVPANPVPPVRAPARAGMGGA